MEEVNALDKTFEIAEESDGVVILAYSLSSFPLQGIISRLKHPKKIRILYSAKTDANRAILQFKDLKNACKPLEITGITERFVTSHAKLYVFFKTEEDSTQVTAVLGSFNLTSQTLDGVEIFGLYRFQLKNSFLADQGISNFVDTFAFNASGGVDFERLKKEISGADSKIGYDILVLLLQLWFENNLTLLTIPISENTNYFASEDKRTFVSTYGSNTLLRQLREMLSSAFICASETGKGVELKILSPFHNERSIEALFHLKEEVCHNLRLQEKVNFTLKLLTNNYTVCGEIAKSSFSNPSYLMNKNLHLNHNEEFKVKFWGYTPGNEDFIHAKLLVVQVGDRQATLLTSANLTLPGFGFGDQKNLEVGVIENDYMRTQQLGSWFDSCWDLEIEPKDTNFWIEIQNWFERLKEDDTIGAEFEVEGLADNVLVFHRQFIKVRDKKAREIELLKLNLSFSKKDFPVKNIEKILEKKTDYFYTDFLLEDEHLGYTFCDIIGKLKDGTYIVVLQKKVEVVKRFPSFRIQVSHTIDVPKELLNGTIPMEIEIETGKDVLKVDLTKIAFRLQTESKNISPKILLVKEKVGINRLLAFLVWVEPFQISDSSSLILLYDNLVITSCVISKEVFQKIFMKSQSENIIHFLENRSLLLITDEQTLCPKVRTELKLVLCPDIAELLQINKLAVIRDFAYSDLIGMRKNTLQVTNELNFKEKISLDNNIMATPPIDVEAWIYGVHKEESVIWVPLGTIKYRLLKNPPEIGIKHYPPITSNITPIELWFNFSDSVAIKDKLVLQYELGKSRKTITLESDSSVLELPNNSDFKDLKEGLKLGYRFVFKYNVADVVGQDHIDYSLFISSPHLSLPAKTKILIFDLKNPQNLINRAFISIPDNFRPSITIYPCVTTHKSFKLRINNKTFEESQEYLSAISLETLSFNKLDKDISQQLACKNIANFEIHISTEGGVDLLSLPFSVFYLEGIETDPFVTMREGGYGKSITIYHPEPYSGDFKNEISKIALLAYSNHLLKSHIGGIKDGVFSWIISPEEEQGVIANIQKFMESTKSKELPIKFRPRKPLYPWEETTLPGRRIIDFIIINRISNHELKIEIKSLKKQ